MKTLVIVDFQKDFANPSGSLYVKGSEQAEEAIVNYITKNAKDLSDVIFTVDWHSPNHCSFEKNGGIWPVHCVQFSEGAGISDKILKACIDNNISYQIFQKGTNDEEEEYGAFAYIGDGTVSMATTLIVALLAGGIPYFQRTSSISLSCPHGL